MNKTKEPSKADMMEIKRRFESSGLKVSVGG
jgi:hypothetical protein